MPQLQAMEQKRMEVVFWDKDPPDANQVVTIADEWQSYLNEDKSHSLSLFEKIENLRNNAPAFQFDFYSNLLSKMSKIRSKENPFVTMPMIRNYIQTLKAREDFDIHCCDLSLSLNLCCFTFMVIERESEKIADSIALKLSFTKTQQKSMLEMLKDLNICPPRLGANLPQ